MFSDMRSFGNTNLKLGIITDLGEECDDEVTCVNRLHKFVRNTKVKPGSLHQFRSDRHNLSDKRQVTCRQKIFCQIAELY